MEFEWDPAKAVANRLKHGVEFLVAQEVFEDDRAVTIRDDSEDEERFVTIGLDSFGRLIVVVYTWRDDAIRLISARMATRREIGMYEESI